ncbi:hypothetical protein D3C76_1176380 [compost metagenome]
MVLFNAWQYREFLRIQTYELNFGSTCRDEGVEIVFDLHVDFLGRQFLDDLDKKLGWQYNTTWLFNLNYAFISLFDLDDGLNRYIRVTCCQRHTLMINVEFDPAQDGDCRTAGDSFGYMLDGFVQVAFHYADFHGFTPS